MVVVLKNELEQLNNLLCDMSDFIEGDDELYGLITHYEYCTYQSKQLLSAIQGVQEKFNHIWDLWEKWYLRQKRVEEIEKENKKQ